MDTVKGGMALPDEIAEHFENTYPAPLETARLIAIQLIEAHGTTHTGKVLSEMERRGYRMPPTLHWAGAIFRNHAFLWTGEYNQGRGHDKLAKLWRLA
jgi:hypothetical protein